MEHIGDEAAEDDEHMCLRCQQTIMGLDNYVLHRRSKCAPPTSLQSPHHTPPREPEEPQHPPAERDTLNQLETTPTSGTRGGHEEEDRSGPYYYNSPSKAFDFFQSLELKSMHKTRLEDLLELDLTPIQKDLPSTSTTKHADHGRFTDIDLEASFEPIVDLIKRSKIMPNYEDLEHENFLADLNMEHPKSRSSILDSDIFGSAGSMLGMESCPSPVEQPPPPPRLQQQQQQQQPGHTKGKWMPGQLSRSAYFCRACNRRLSSRVLYDKHMHSELHFKRLHAWEQLEEAEEPSGAAAHLHPHPPPPHRREQRSCHSAWRRTPQHSASSSLPGRAPARACEQVSKPRRQYARSVMCAVCQHKVARHLLGKHLVSYRHCIRAKYKPEEAKKLIFEHMGLIVRNAPFQCGLCHFYCNIKRDFETHLLSEYHDERDKQISGVYWCMQCKALAIALPDLMIHLKSDEHLSVVAALNRTMPVRVNKRTLWRCSHCSKQVFLKLELVQHLRAHHKLVLPTAEVTFPCDQCSFVAYEESKLLQHRVRRHAAPLSTQYKCTACKVELLNKRDYLNHRQTSVCREKRLALNGKSTARRCTLCGLRCENLSQLKDHVFSVHPGSTHRCMCGSEFAISQDLSYHVRENTCKLGNKTKGGNNQHQTFICDLCKKHFVRRRNLAKHYKKKHWSGGDGVVVKRKVAATRKAPTPKTVLRCALCKFTSDKKCFMQRHMAAIHFPVDRRRTWCCRVCNKGFFDKYSLRHHVKVHEPRLLVCKKTAECRYKARYHSEMARHVASVHAKKLQMFLCRLCPYKAITKFELCNHVSSNHQAERSHACQHCGQRFELQSHLRRHTRLHTGSKPYNCPHCPYRCNTLENLRKHILVTKKHPGKAMYTCKLCIPRLPPFRCNAANEFRVHLHERHPTEARRLGTKNILAYVAGICPDFTSMVQQENYRVRRTPARRNPAPKPNPADVVKPSPATEKTETTNISNEPHDNKVIEDEVSGRGGSDTDDGPHTPRATITPGGSDTEDGPAHSPRATITPGGSDTEDGPAHSPRATITPGGSDTEDGPAHSPRATITPGGSDTEDGPHTPRATITPKLGSTSSGSSLSLSELYGEAELRELRPEEEPLVLGLQIPSRPELRLENEHECMILIPCGTPSPENNPLNEMLVNLLKPLLPAADADRVIVQSVTEPFLPSTDNKNSSQSK